MLLVEILKVFFLRRRNLIFENFAQENGQKIFKHAHKEGKNGQKSLEN